MNKFVLLLFACALLLLTITQTLGQVDIVTPEDNLVTNAIDQTFEYYVGLTNPIRCELLIQDQTLPDTTVQEGFNSFIVQSLTPGSYVWSISCENATQTQNSEQRSFTIDVEEPQIQLTKPDVPDDSLTVRFTVADNNSSSLLCQVYNNGTNIQTTTVESGEWYEESFSIVPGEYSLEVTCTDDAGNSETITRAYSIEREDYLILSMNKQLYSLGEQVLLTIDAPSDASLTVDICPNEEGFVECLSPIIDTGFPQTIELPYNKSGEFFVEGIMSTPRGTTINSTSYSVDNTIGITLEIEGDLVTKNNLTLSAEVFNAFGDIMYVWELSNGSTITTNEKEIILYNTPAGSHTQTVTITDSAENQKTESITYQVKEAKQITVYVKDQNQRAVEGATVQIGDVKRITDNTGKTSLSLAIGSNKLYAGKQGYASTYTTKIIEETTTSMTLTITKENLLAVAISSPAEAASFGQGTQVPVKFTVTGAANAECTYYLGLVQDDFLEAKSTVTVPNANQQGFGVSDLEVGTYAYSIECSQNGISASSPRKTFVVTASSVQTNTLPDEEKLFFEDAIASLKNLGREEQELMSLMGFENELKQAKKRAGQLGRDIYDVRYRDDLSASEKDRERARLQKEMDALMEKTPISVEVVDSKTLVDYITKEEINVFIEENGEELQISSKALSAIVNAQQQYTMKTQLYRAIVKESDGETTDISVVYKTITYGKNDATTGPLNARLIEIIPKKYANSAADIVVLSEDSKILIDDPVLSFPTKGSILYYVKEDIPFTVMEDVRTLLLPEIEVESNVITGFSIAGAGTLTKIADNLGISLFLLVAIIVALYLIHHFGLLEQAKYVLYTTGPKKQTHYMRVLLNDIHDQIRVGDYDKAILIYKELKLSYDTLPIPARNELYEEILNVCAKLDLSYLRDLVVKMHTALKEDRLEDAVNYFEKIEGTFSRLPLDEQKNVKEMVEGLAKRLGVTA